MSGLSRRELLAALSAVGAGGALVGVGTGAVLRDRTTMGSLFTTGAFDLEVEWKLLAGNDAGTAGFGAGTFELDVGGLSPGERGAALLSFSLPAVEDGTNNPGYAWLRAFCPQPAGTLLAESLHVTLSYANCVTEAAETGIDGADGSLREVANALRNGVPLDAAGTNADPGEQACLAVDDPLCLRLDWRLDDDYVGTETATVAFEVVGTQCRSHDGTEDPFAGVDRPECPVACRCCAFLGKLDLDPSETDQPGIGDSSIEPGTYTFTEGSSEYVLVVPEPSGGGPTTVDKDGGTETVAVEFEVRDADGDDHPTLCRVDVKGSTGLERYETLDGNATGGLLYAPLQSGSGDAPDDYYAISHLTVYACSPDPDCETTAPGGGPN
jgi:hypothetical protein